MADGSRDISRRRNPADKLTEDLLIEILSRVPYRSLCRFKCVSKAWRDTISDDPSFQRDLRLRRRDLPCFLIAPQIKSDKGIVATAGLYRWEETHGAATLVHPLDSLPADVIHGFAHCDGLVLVGTNSEAWVLYPTTRRIRAMLSRFRA